ncbi:ELWxxDGT repeat protein [Luteolibacter luteus]|uniref:ELWxxDGT repeat protein n=1 Tax=Luteolibacter luteus TaxID=2728835 RepID=A0A858RQG5_9BACT|nr:ELWxxDGT repeat protein [Luteolibacter luteus]QJE98774.1 hypothetical protein HHL09_24335 [Luteolibacter luteus]
MHFRALLLAALSGLSSLSFGENTPRLVRDVNLMPMKGGDIWNPFSHSPQKMVRVGDVIYFAASDIVHGRELWKTDGTEAGTVVVTDLRPGYWSSSPGNLTAFGDRLFFSADHDGLNGDSFWTSDGTPEGTVILEGFAGGAAAGDLSLFEGSGGKLFFRKLAVGSGGSAGFFAWDGTAAGPVELNGPPSARPFQSYDGKKLSFVPGTLMFASGPDLWQSDGTVAGTVKVASLPGGQGSLELLEIAGDTLFLSRLPTGGVVREFWKHVRGSNQLENVQAGGAGGLTFDRSVSPVTCVADGKLFVVARQGTSPRKLWVSDGAAGGMRPVEDVRGMGYGNPEQLTAVGSQVYFVGADGTGGREVWKADGTTASASQVTDLWTAEAGEPTELVALDGLLCFGMREAENLVSLWKTDGTTGGTTRLKLTWSDGPVPPRSFMHLNSQLIFVGSAEEGSQELWTTDGSVEGTGIIKDVTPGNLSGLPSLGSGSFLAIGTTLYFGASDGLHVPDLWKSTGTQAGTRLASPTSGRGAYSPPDALTQVGKTIYFTTSSVSSSGWGQMLWKANQRSGRATKVREQFIKGDITSGVRSMLPLKKKLLMVVSGFDGEAKLWTTNGMPGGTRQMKKPDLELAWPYSLVPMGDRAYFAAASAESGYGLWQMNRTGGKPSLLKEMPGFSLEALTAMGNTLFFIAKDPSSGDARLWKSDGSAGGTVPVTPAGFWLHGGYTLDLLIPCGDKLYFMADDGAHGSELWVSDGSAEATRMVKDIHPADGPAPRKMAEDFFAAGNILYFTADDGVHGEEVWRTDGTEAGTSMLADIQPGEAGSEAWGFTTVGSRLYFSAYNNQYGHELWSSDGSQAGTVLVSDLVPGSGSSNPVWPIAVGDRLYFGATTLEHGQELWVIDGADQQ